MRRKSREINIFNLSMMDVISGAMGAFLIIMIVLARYYESDPGNKENVEAIKAELQSARARLKEIETLFRRAGIESAEIPQALEKSTREIKKAEDDLEKLREQLDQAKQEIERQEERERKLLQRRAFAVSANWNCPGAEIDLYLWDTQHGIDGTDPEPLDPSKEQFAKWTGDHRAEWDAGPPEMWLVTSSVAETEYKVYLKLMKPVPSCTVTTTIVHAGNGKRYVSTLTAAEPWIFLAKVRQTNAVENAHFEITDATEAERAAERAALAARMGSS